MKIRANVRKVENEDSRIKGYADLTLENCVTLYNTRIVENKDGELFVSYPQKAVFEDGEPKLHEDGSQVYSDIYYARTKEANDAIKALVLEAYHSEKGYAYINPAQGEPVNAFIEPKLHACNGDRVKASGYLEVGGYMKIPDVFVSLHQKTDGEYFLGISYPHYKTKDDEYKDFVELHTKGKVWDKEAKTEKDYNFKSAVEGLMKKQTREMHPELSDILKPSVQERIDDAKSASENSVKADGKGMESIDKEPEPVA